MSLFIVFSMDPNTTISHCVGLLTSYRGLIETQITSSYTNDVYSHVPSSWIDSLQSWPYEKLVHLTDFLPEVTDPGLQSFLRTAVSLYPDYPQFTEELHPSGLERQGMTPKKTHEVQRFAAFIERVANSLGVSHVVDLGAGLCYLSHFLSTKCRLSVKGVEAKDHNSHSAKTRGERISSKLNLPDCQFEVVSMHVTTANFESLCSDPCLLVGLHTCGDLAATSLRMAVSLTNVKAVMNVGCCYNLLSESVHPQATNAVAQYVAQIGTNDKGSPLDHTFVSEQHSGYPMSAFLRDTFPDFFLGRMARMLALNDFSDSMLRSPATHFEKYSYRAAFQWLLRQHCPHIEGTVSVGRRIKHYSSFGDYVLQICAKRGVGFQLSVEQLDAVYEAEFRWREKRAAALWVLRAVLGPVVENLLLCDRLVYLREQGVKAEAWQVFDRAISPRGVVIVGVKT